jgi:hypothetical protein
MVLSVEQFPTDEIDYTSFLGTPPGLRAGRSMMPGYDMYSAAKSSLSKSFSTMSPQPKYSLDLAKDTPLSYGTE